MENYNDVRDVKKWGKPEYFHSDIDQFESVSTLESGIHTIMHQGVPIDVLMDVNLGTPLCFIFKGNTRRKATTKLPVFVGFSMVPPGKTSRVSISDPSMYLHPTIGLAWYAGGNDLDLQSVLPRVVQKIVSACSPSKVLMIGGSGGGHAAMYYSRFVKDSLAVAWNPQDDFLNYEENGVIAYVSKAYDVHTVAEAKLKLSGTIDTEISSFYKRTEPTNYIVYLQNVVDTHVEKHCRPFMASIGHDISYPLSNGQIDERTYLYFSDKWGGDHEPPPKEFLNYMARALIEHPGTWAEMMATGEIVSLLEAADELAPSQEQVMPQEKLSASAG